MCADFDAMLRHDWRRLGISAEEVREFCVWRNAPMRVLSSQGDLVDSYDPALKERRTVCFLAFDGHCYVQGREALERQAARVLYRGEARQTLPPIQEWRRFDAADVQPGLFWCKDLRRQLMAAGESPKVAISSPAQYCGLRLRWGTRIRELPEEQQPVGSSRAPRMEAEVERGGRPYKPLPGGQLPAAHRSAGHRKDAPGPDDCGEAARAGRGGEFGVQALLRAEPGGWGRRGSAQKLDWLVVEEITQLDMALWADLACVGLNADVKFLLLGDFRQLPAVLDSWAGRPISAPLEHSQLIRDLAGGHRHELTENMRSDPGIFNFVKRLRVGEEACPTLEQVKELFPSKPGWPDTTLVISHSKRMAVNAAANRALAAEGLKAPRAGSHPHGLLRIGTNPNSAKQPAEHEGVAGAAPHWGKDTQGGFVAAAEVEPDGVRLGNGMRLKNQELLRATRPSHAVTYASCQGLTLHNRVRLDLESCHLTLRHLYVGASQARGPCGARTPRGAARGCRPGPRRGSAPSPSCTSRACPWRSP